MIIWSDKCYLTEAVRPGIKKIKKSIEKPEKLRFGAYLITLCDNGTDLLEIYDILFFPAGFYKGENKDVVIVGVAESSNAAKELAGSIIMDVNRETGTFDVGKYFGN